MAEVSCTEIWSWTTSCWIKTAISRSRTLECAKKVSTETRLPRRSAEHPITSHRKLVFRFFLTKAIATYTAYYIYIYTIRTSHIYEDTRLVSIRLLVYCRLYCINHTESRLIGGHTAYCCTKCWLVSRRSTEKTKRNCSPRLRSITLATQRVYRRRPEKFVKR